METALARTTDPATSHEAASSIDVSRMETLVHSTLRAFGPQTCSEIADRLGVARDSVSPRMKRLVEKKLAEDTGERRIPPGKTRSSILWKAVDNVR